MLTRSRPIATFGIAGFGAVSLGYVWLRNSFAPFNSYNHAALRCHRFLACSFRTFLIAGLCDSEGGIERLDHLVHMLLLDDVRRQEAQHRIVRAIDQNALREQVGYNRLREIGRVQLDREHHADTADCLYGRMLTLQALQSTEEISTDFR